MFFLQYTLFFIVTISIDSIKSDRERFDKVTETAKPVDHTEVIQVNVGGEWISTTRETLMKIDESTLAILFNGQWEHKLERDRDNNIFFDFNPTLFRHLLYQLQVIDLDEPIELYPPFEPSLVVPFHKMLRKLGLEQWLLPEEKNVITFNAGGQIIRSQRTTFIEVSNVTFDQIFPPTKTMASHNESDVFVDYDPKLFQHLISHLRKNSSGNMPYPKLLLDEEKIAFKKMLNDLNINQQIISSPISVNTKWEQHGMTIAGGRGQGNRSDQLFRPLGLYVDDDDNQSVYIADHMNHRIVKWKLNATAGEIVAGGNRRGNRTDQFNKPTDVIVDKSTDSLIICDHENRRVVRWPRRNGKNGQTIISNVDCARLATDGDGYFYVSDWNKNEVRRWKVGETNGTVVAGGNGKGDQLNQLNHPTYIFVDDDHSIYVSNWDNERVMKWPRNAKEGIVVASKQGTENSSIQLSSPHGVVVDHLGNVYVADAPNQRITCWSKGSKEGRIIVGGNGEGEESNQFAFPHDLSFDRQGHLYVVDFLNHRVQKFEINWD